MRNWVHTTVHSLSVQALFWAPRGVKEAGRGGGRAVLVVGENLGMGFDFVNFILNFGVIGGSGWFDYDPLGQVDRLGSADDEPLLTHMEIWSRTAVSSYFCPFIRPQVRTPPLFLRVRVPFGHRPFVVSLIVPAFTVFEHLRYAPERPTPFVPFG